MKKFEAQDAIRNAEELFADRYAGAECCFAAGSIVRDEGTALSDLDLVVVYPKLETAYRESFIHHGMPIEAFVHDYETVQAFIDDDYQSAHVPIIDMIATGKIIPAESIAALKLKNYTVSLLEKGPEKLSSQKVMMTLYSIGDSIDDLRGDRPPQEQRAILYELYPQIGEFALRQMGKFATAGKHLPRSLKLHCPDLFQSLEDIMQAAHQDELKPQHVQQLQNILDKLGGSIFDGYKLDAPAEKRAKPIWLEPK